MISVLSESAFASRMRLTTLLLLVAGAWLGSGAGVHAQLTTGSGAQNLTSGSGTGPVTITAPLPITTPGTYYLTKDVVVSGLGVDGVDITASNVTLDLNGFTITTQAANTYYTNVSNCGVCALGCSNVTVRNGQLNGFQYGVLLGISVAGQSSYNDSVAYGNAVEDVILNFNTVAGIYLQGGRNVVRRCTVGNTGGSTVSGQTTGYGVRCAGPANEVLSTSVNVVSSPGYGIWFGQNAVDTLAEGNRIGGASTGIYFDSTGATGKYLRNLIFGDVSQPFSGGTDAGNNAPPTLTSTGTAIGQAGAGFSYQITATELPTSFGATGLPTGLSVNSSTGLISGSPTTAGSYNISLSASNKAGRGTALLNLTILPPQPVVTSSLATPGYVDAAYNYQITATSSPTSYGASNLPSWLAINSSTGTISGTPTAAGSYNITLSATNAGGTGTANLALIVTDVRPVITNSGIILSGQVGHTLNPTYIISATNDPSSFSTLNLPDGLLLNTTTGEISGTPTTAGTTNVTITAFNAHNFGSAILVVTIKPPVPVITSALSGTGMTDRLFTYQISASYLPTDFAATNLPTGLTIDSSGLINGTPTQAGTYAVVLSATNAGGVGTAVLSLTIVIGNAATFLSQSLPCEMLAGQNYSVTISLVNAGAATWNAGGYQLVYVSPDGTQPSCWNIAQVPLNGSVAPGQSAPFSFVVTAPAAPGHYSFHWQMSAVKPSPQPSVVFGATTSDFTVAVVSQSSVANVLQNAGFEAPAVSDGSYAVNPVNAGWTFTGTAGVSSNTSIYASASAPAPESNQAAYLCNIGSMSQLSTSLAAGTYVVGFRAAQGGTTETLQQLSVSVDGAPLGLFAPATLDYTFYTSAPFTVSSIGAVSVSFAGTQPGGTDSTVLIDDVRIFSVAAGGTPYGGTATVLPGRLLAANFDAGGQNVGFSDTTPYNEFAAISGNLIYRDTAVDIRPSQAAGKFVIDKIEPGEYLNFSVNALSAGTYPLIMRAGSAQGGTVRVEIDGLDVSGSLNITAQGNYESEINVVAATAVTLPSGSHMVRIVDLSGEISVDWLSLDMNASGVPAWWMTLYNIPAGTDLTASAPRNDGLSYLQAFQQDLNPNDVFDGQAPILSIVDGDHQAGVSNSTLAKPLIVLMEDHAGRILQNALVNFVIDSGTFSVANSSLGYNSSIRTDASGQAKIFVTLPGSAPTTCHITVSAQTIHINATVASVDVNSGGEGDLDENGLPDWWEVKYFGANGQDPAGDPDQDGLCNILEYQRGGDPTNPDTDGDGVLDGRDAVPYDNLLRHGAVPESTYAVVDLGEGVPTQINDGAQITLDRIDQTSAQPSNYSYMWKNGQLTTLGFTASTMNNSGVIVGSTHSDGPLLGSATRFINGQVEDLEAYFPDFYKAYPHDLYVGSGATDVFASGEIFGGIACYLSPSPAWNTGYGGFNVDLPPDAKPDHSVSYAGGYFTGTDYPDPRTYGYKAPPNSTGMMYVGALCCRNDLRSKYYAHFVVALSSAGKDEGNSKYSDGWIELAGAKLCAHSVVGGADPSYPAMSFLDEDPGMAETWDTPIVTIHSRSGTSQSPVLAVLRNGGWQRVQLKDAGKASGNNWSTGAVNNRGEILLNDISGTVAQAAIWHNGHVDRLTALTNSPSWNIIAANDINNAGVIVATGADPDGDTGPTAHNHTLLLLPILLSVTNDVTAQGGWLPPNGLLSPGFSMHATIKSVSGLTVVAELFQDIASDRAIIYDDESSSRCAHDYLADDPYEDIFTHKVEHPVKVTNTSDGTITLDWDDQPAFPVASYARHSVIGMHLETVNVRDFIRISVGDNPIQLVSEAKWTTRMNAYFTEQEPDMSKFLNSNSAPYPTAGMTVYGKKPDDPLVAPRGPAANDYVNITGSWKARGRPSSVAILHPKPF